MRKPRLSGVFKCGPGRDRTYDLRTKCLDEVAQGLGLVAIEPLLELVADLEGEHVRHIGSDWRSRSDVAHVKAPVGFRVPDESSYAARSADSSSLRDLIPSFANTLRRCHSTVLGLRNSWLAIAGFVWPSRASWAI